MANTSPRVLTVNMNIRTKKQLRDQFARACKRNGMNQSDILRRLMADYAAGNITYTETLEVAS